MTNFSYSQFNKFDSLAHRMFFNILIHSPDSSVIDFIQKYYPMFCSPPQKHKWTIYPKQEELPQFMNTIHSYEFKHHPFFDCKFREGRIDFITSETKNEGRGLRDYKLWFLLDSKADAIRAFNKLKIMFEKVSTIKKITEIKNRLIANFTDKEILLRTNSIEFILMKDELYDKQYKILFRIGSFTYPNTKNASDNFNEIKY